MAIKMEKRYCLLPYFLIFIICGQIKAQQTNALGNQELMKEDIIDFYKLYGLKNQQPKFVDYYDLTTLFELKVSEVTDTFRRFNGDVGSNFYYCGDIAGGIKNILQTQISSTPHVFFLNKPIEKRYVLFYGRGYHMKNSKTRQDSASKCNDFRKQIFNGREMVLKILQEQFNFEVKESQDSLEYLSLKILDSTKLMTHKTPLEKYIHGGWARVDSINKIFVGSCASLLWISARIEKQWNIYNDEETHTHGIYFDYQIPLELFDSKEKLPKLTAYLEQNLGLTIVKTKRLEIIYTINFKNTR